MCKDVYSFEDSQPVIKEAWNLAVDHLKTVLGDQYEYNATKYAWEKFQDYVEQDIECKMRCDRCSKVDIEGNFQEYQDFGNICYECYLEKK